MVSDATKRMAEILGADFVPNGRLSHPLASGTISTPSHPFTPDVVAWAEDMVKHYATGPITPMVALRVKAARQILAAVGRG